MNNPPKKNLWRWLFMAISCWIVIIAAIYLTNLYLNVFTFIICLLVVMSRQHALLLLGHDAAHYLICNNKKLNNFLSYLFVGPAAFSLNRYRQFHFLHHRHVNTPEDPEMLIRSPELKEYRLPKNKKEFIIIIIKDLCGLNFGNTIKVFNLFRPLNFKDFISIYASLGLIIALLAYLKMYWVYLLMIIGYLIIFPMMLRFRTWTEHWGAPHTHVIKVGPLARFFLYPCNTWCHKEHHHHPNLPYYYLPQMRTEEDKNNAKTTLALFRDLSTYKHTDG